MAALGSRDFDYIEGRLLVPASELIEVIDRLQSRGFAAEAAELMEALKSLQDVTRKIRYTLQEQRNQRQGV